jgi:hypothetical protein
MGSLTLGLRQGNPRGIGTHTHQCAALTTLFAPFAFFLGFFFTCLCFGHPVTLIGVDCLIVAPFCAVNAVGIFNVLLHRFVFAANAEYLPCGNVSSNVPTGASGTVRNVLLVIPALLMNVSACNWMVVP